LGHNVQDFDGFNKSILKRSIFKRKLDFVFIALHGTFGEDGSIQEILEQNQIKYNGSNSKASEDCFNKIRTKRICGDRNILTPQWYSISQDTWAPPSEDHLYPYMIDTMLSYPLIVKPSRQGSSIGITILHDKTVPEQKTISELIDDSYGSLSDGVLGRMRPNNNPLISAIDKALECNDGIQSLHQKNEALIEEYIYGKEITVSILGDKALPIIEIKPHSNVYDYKSKYTKGETDYVCPAQFDFSADIDGSLSGEIQDTALEVHKLLGCQVYSRVDFRLSKNNKFWLLEINTLPGMTETSLFPMAAKATGLSFEDLIDKIIKLSLEK